MIEYDYTIIRDEFDEVKTYVPEKIPKNLSNIVYIEGPNSSGKSTLLNIIALGFYGNQNTNINPELRYKINSLLDTDYQKINFRIKIENSDGSFSLTTEKNDAEKTDLDIFENINGKKNRLCSDNFNRYYNLIYDIPNDPTGRLKDLTSSILSTQEQYKNRVERLSSEIRHVISEIKNSRDPEKINEFKDKLKNTEDKKDKTKEKIESVERILETLQRYTYCKYYSEYFSELNRKNKKYEDLKKEIKNHDKENRSISKKTRYYLSSIEDKIEKLEGLHSDLSTNLKKVLPKEESHKLLLWDDIDINISLKNLKFDDSIKNIIKHFDNSLNAHLQKSNEELTEAKLYTGLIEFLEHYRSSKIVLPGLDKSIEEFIEILEETNKVNTDLLRASSNINKTLSKLAEFNNIIISLENDFFPNIKKIKMEALSDLADEKNDGIQEKIEKLGNDTKKLEKKCKYYETECARIGIQKEEVEGIINQIEGIDELSPYFKFTEDQLFSKIEELSKEVLSYKKEIKSLETYCEIYKNEIIKLEKMEPHKYQDFSDKLIFLNEKCGLLRQNLINYNSYLDYVKNPSNPKKIDNKDYDAYYSELCKFLGYKIGYIRHIDKEYKVDSIDLLKKMIYTSEGKIIRMADMGTGQGQAAYLLGLLNSADDRKIIALFDEVAMMDSISLKPIFNKLKELYEEGRLVLGIVVQKAETINILPHI